MSQSIEAVLSESNSLLKNLKSIKNVQVTPHTRDLIDIATFSLKRLMSQLEADNKPVILASTTIKPIPIKAVSAPALHSSVRKSAAKTKNSFVNRMSALVSKGLGKGISGPSRINGPIAPVPMSANVPMNMMEQPLQPPQEANIEAFFDYLVAHIQKVRVQNPDGYEKLKMAVQQMPVQLFVRRYNQWSKKFANGNPNILELDYNEIHENTVRELFNNIMNM